MTAEEITQAEQLAKNWKASPAFNNSDIAEGERKLAPIKKIQAERIASYIARAEKGDPYSMSFLIRAYHYGDDTEKNEAEAQKWIAKAVAKNDATMFLQLRLAYTLGCNTKEQQDCPEMLKWVHKAAEMGDHSADEKLSAMYTSGLGTPKDNFQAYLWCKEAAVLAGGQCNELANMMKYRKQISRQRQTYTSILQIEIMHCRQQQKKAMHPRRGSSMWPTITAKVNPRATPKA